ncbi:hypothetical protein Gotur_027598 [Gossypium turneri]
MLAHYTQHQDNPVISLPNVSIQASGGCLHKPKESPLSLRFHFLSYNHHSVFFLCGSASLRMAKKKNTLVFMDVSIDGDPVERMVFEVLF